MARDWQVNKGECPVAEETLVDVIFRDGTTTKRELASGWTWSEMGSTSDIVFWRLSKEKK